MNIECPLCPHPQHRGLCKVEGCNCPDPLDSEGAERFSRETGAPLISVPIAKGKESE